MRKSKTKATTTTQSLNNAINHQNNRFSIMSSFFAFSEKLASSSYLKWTLMMLLPVLILLRYPVDRLDYDLWWQMTLGKYYLSHHTLIIDHSIFSWTPADPTWVYNKWFGAGLDSFVPAREVSFLKKYRLEGPIFNDYVIGGYLIWDLYPDYKIFIDPRFMPFSKQVAADYWAFTGNPVTSETLQRFNKKYPFKIAIIHYRELPLIFDFLRAGGEWRLLYFEQNAAILIHKSLLSTIPPEISSVDLGPSRFQKVRNPEVLLNVFTLYVNLDPNAGRVIYDIYKKNISDCYKLKKDHLQTMEDDIRQKEHELQFMINGQTLPANR